MSIPEVIVGIPRNAPRLAFIGLGSIFNEMVRSLDMRGQRGTLVAALGRQGTADKARQRLPGHPIVDTIAELLDRKPDIVIEAAGHEAVENFGPLVVAKGCAFIPASIGALANPKTAAALAGACRDGGDVYIASGAIAGLDGLLAARTCNLQTVCYTSVKEPRAWIGTPAEPLLSKNQSESRFVFFEGSAREAAGLYPKNVNVGAAVALAGLGFEQTRIKLASEPAIPGPLGIIEAAGAFGTLRFEILALASPDNPKTSWITGHSLVSAALDGMCFPVGKRLSPNAA